MSRLVCLSFYEMTSKEKREIETERERQMDGWTVRQTSDKLGDGQTQRWTGRKINRKSRKYVI
jgi:hypothetical protein